MQRSPFIRQPSCKCSPQTRTTICCTQAEISAVILSFLPFRTRNDSDAAGRSRTECSDLQGDCNRLQSIASNEDLPLHRTWNQAIKDPGACKSGHLRASHISNCWYFVQVGMPLLKCSRVPSSSLRLVPTSSITAESPRSPLRSSCAFASLKGYLLVFSRLR